MKQKKWLLLGVFGVALVVNPYLACSNKDEPAFDYGEPEMKAALLGTWQGTAEIGGESIPFSLTMEQASAGAKTQSVGAPGVQPQCASRSFVKPAGACLTMTSMPIVGVLTSEDPDLNGGVDGVFRAFQTLDGAGLSLRLDNGTTLFGSVHGDALSDGAIQGGDLEHSGTFTLSRP